MKYQDKARGMLVGLAVGDALGAPVEFLPAPSDFYIKQQGEKIEHFHKNSRLPAGVWTDDTSMALCIADSLIANKGYDSYDIMRRFYEWCYSDYRKHPQAPLDVGNQTLHALDEWEKSKTIPKDAEKTESAGNAPIMRLAPIIIANTFPNKNYPTLKDGYESGSLVISPEDENSEFIDGKDIAPTLKMAELSCRETHDSIAAITVTELFATTLYSALHGLEKRNILNYASRWMKGEELDDFWISNINELTERPLKRDENQFHDLGGYIVDTFAIALWGLQNFKNFKDGMMAVIRLGGDTDTNAACYGQLAGAYYGYEAIPEEWRNGVYLSDELVKIADQLLEMDECVIKRTRFEDDEFFKPDNA